MRLPVAALAALLTASPAWAFDPYETTGDARARHSAERYEQYRANGNSAPMGGYRERLGDPAPAGTLNPSGSTYGTGSGGGYGVPSYGSGATGSSVGGFGGTWKR